VRRYIATVLTCLGLSAASALVPAAAVAGPVLLISIDGLQPADVLNAKARGLSVPTLSGLVKEGAYAQTVRGVLPTVTYPSHTTIVTGVWPAQHGIYNNQTFDPLQKNRQGWYWYAEDIKVPTLWAAAHKGGMKVVNVHWPVSVGAEGIDLNLPQLWTSGSPDDRKLNRALATKGLTERLEAKVGAYADGIDESVEGDENRGKFAEVLMAEEKPGFATVYFTGLDHVQHESGPDTPQAHAALERIDTAVGKVIAAARKSQPNINIVIVSDHGFAPISKDVNLMGAFIQAGLIKVDMATSKIVSWEATPWMAGGSSAIVLARPDDAALRAKVEGLLDAMKANPELGVDRWIKADEMAALGGGGAQYFLNFKPGFQSGRNPTAPAVSPSTSKGMHGYFPELALMRAALIAAGPDVKAKGALGELDMRDIAPSIARVLGVEAPNPGRKPVF
jgi:predicted AlkP superfamily pyrophosphatase or phosphodiesterase